MLRPNLTATALLAILGWPAACSSAPRPDLDPEHQLAAAESLVADGKPAEAVPLLDELTDEVCPRRLRDRRSVVAARAQLGIGEPFEAFRKLEHFADDHPHSELRPAVTDLLWTIGKQLAESDRGFLFFWSDRRSGRTVLEHLITRHPDTPRLADALRLLGDMAFVDQDYELAQERFNDLLLRRPESEWRVYAQFRYAMSIAASLQGPDYDLDQMGRAARELNSFLASNPESPALVLEARQALAKVVAWQAERHVRIARFYQRVGNDYGARRHLEIAIGDEFRGAPAQAKARELLAGLPAVTAAAATGSPSGGTP